MKQNKSVMYIFLEGAAAVFVILMLGFFPLFYQNNYIDISSAKLSFFRVCVIGLFLFIVVFAALDWLQRFKEEMLVNSRVPQNKKTEKQRVTEVIREYLSGVSIPAWFAVVFVVGICIATIFSINPLESWQGKEGRKLGAMVWLLCVAMYMMLSKYLRPGKWMIWTFLVSNILVCILAILNFWAIDPLGMYENLMEAQHAMFISTIGNVNACASYLCMVLPAGMVLYFLCKDRKLQVITGIFLVLGFWTCYCTKSQSWLLGIGAAFLVLLWFAMCDHFHMRRFLELCSLFWVSSVLMKLTFSIGKMKNYLGLMFRYFMAEGFQNRVMLNGFVLLVMGILFGGGIFYIWKREKKEKELPYHTLRKGVFLFFALTAVAAVLLLVAANLNRNSWEGIFSWLNHLKLQDSFGSSRGYIWRISVKSWLDMPFWKKLTGYGVNCYHMLIQQYGGEGVADVFDGAILVDAHNEFLQFMTTMGIVGTVGYFGLLVSTAVTSFKKYVKQPEFLLGVAVVCGYAAQAMVNNPTVFLTPYLFLMLGIIRSMEKLGDVAE